MWLNFGNRNVIAERHKRWKDVSIWKMVSSILLLQYSLSYGPFNDKQSLSMMIMSWYQYFPSVSVKRTVSNEYTLCQHQIPSNKNMLNNSFLVGAFSIHFLLNIEIFFHSFMGKRLRLKTIVQHFKDKCIKFPKHFLWSDHICIKQSMLCWIFISRNCIRTLAISKISRQRKTSIMTVSGTVR